MNIRSICGSALAREFPGSHAAVLWTENSCSMVTFARKRAPTNCL